MVESTQKILARNQQLRQLSKIPAVANSPNPAAVLEIDVAFNFLE